MTAHSSSQVSRLFAHHDQLRAVVEAVLEGPLGEITDRDGAARLALGCYEIFAGDAASPSADELVASAARPRELIYGNDPAWRELIERVHGEGVADRPMREFDASRLDRTELARLATVPEDCALRPLDAELAAQLDRGLEPHGLQTYRSPAELARNGLGFGAVLDGRLASAATSYARSSRRIEVAIATRPDYRGRGLATAAAAALLLRCLDLGLTPHWSAANPTSQRLAIRLGFQPAGICEVLYLVEPSLLTGRRCRG